MRGITISFLIFWLVLAAGLGFAEETGRGYKEVSYVWEFAEVSEGDVIEHTFLVKNDSENTLQIKSIHTSCGCTTSEVKEKEIPAGESLEIKVKFDTKGYFGKRRQAASIHTDQQDVPIIKLILSADISKRPKSDNN
ncbi:MAG: DUF1573 domain-containing protein [Candidatus Omnitrophota bacterium]